jgi:hypothetical protein
LGWHPVLYTFGWHPVLYTFTHKQYTEHHN